MRIVKKEKNENILEITEDVRIPETNVILEAGDRIKILESRRKYRVARSGDVVLDGGDVNFEDSDYAPSQTVAELYRDSSLIKEINDIWIKELTRQVDTPPVSSVNSSRELEMLFNWMMDEETFSFVDFDVMTARAYISATASSDGGGGWGNWSSY